MRRGLFILCLLKTAPGQRRTASLALRAVVPPLQARKPPRVSVCPQNARTEDGVCTNAFQQGSEMVPRGL